MYNNTIIILCIIVVMAILLVHVHVVVHVDDNSIYNNNDYCVVGNSIVVYMHSMCIGCPYTLCVYCMSILINAHTYMYTVLMVLFPL